MAKVQACGSAEIFLCQHKSVVDEIFTKVLDFLNEILCLQGAATAGSIMNMNSKDNCIRLLKSHDWSGKIKKPYPDSIARCNFGTFAHAAHFLGLSDEAAVVYSDGCGSAWLLAWSVKDVIIGIPHRNKVHVETGPMDNYINIDWCNIKAKLENSKDISYCFNPCTGNEVFAHITSGNKAKLAACYNNLC